jgi:hypothetical protein
LSLSNKDGKWYVRIPDKIDNFINGWYVRCNDLGSNFVKFKIYPSPVIKYVIWKR